jgi:hypothetical protein
MADTSKPRRFLRFGLRALLLLVAAISLVLGWTLHKAREQGVAVAAFANAGCGIAYRDDADPTSPNTIERCRKLLGEQPWIDVGYLICAKSQITDAGLAHLRGLPQLRSLSLDSTSVTDAGLVHLRFLPELAELNLANTEITDAGLEYVGACAQLEDLDLSGTRVTDAGLVHLQSFRHLKTLRLNPTAVTEDGVEKLQRAMPFLKILSWW